MKTINKNISFFEKNFKSLVVLSILILIALFYFLLFANLINSWQKINTGIIEEKEETLLQKQQILNELKQLQTNYDNISLSLKEKVGKILPL